MTDTAFEIYTKYGFQNTRSMLMKKGKEGYFSTDPIHTYRNQQTCLLRYSGPTQNAEVFRL